MAKKNNVDLKALEEINKVGIQDSEFSRSLSDLCAVHSALCTHGQNYYTVGSISSDIVRIFAKGHARLNNLSEKANKALKEKDINTLKRLVNNATNNTENKLLDYYLKTVADTHDKYIQSIAQESTNEDNVRFSIKTSEEIIKECLEYKPDVEEDINQVFDLFKFNLKSII